MDAMLLLLAGGESRRMGRPKALLPVGGVTLAEWQLARLAPGFAQVGVAAGTLELPASLRPLALADLHPGAGPLAAIEAGLAASAHDVMVVVACDLPGAGPELLRRLCAAAAGHAAAVPRLNGLPQPTCAAYRPQAAAPIRRALDEGRRQARAVLSELDVRWLDGEEPGQFENLNTPADYERFLGRIGHPG